MRNAMLILSAAATLTTGIVGGLATNPVPKPPQENDWRQRYRASPSAAATDPVSADDFGWGGWSYGLPPLAREAVYAPLVPDLPPALSPPPLEYVLPEDPWAQSAADLQPGPAAVADALARTDSIAVPVSEAGPSTRQVDARTGWASGAGTTRRRGQIPQRHGWRQKPSVQEGGAMEYVDISSLADAEVAAFASSPFGVAL